jgi:hypothetical protein
VQRVEFHWWYVFQLVFWRTMRAEKIMVTFGYGTWNDYPNVISHPRYVVEYGGLANDPCISISDTKTVVVVLNHYQQSALLQSSTFMP